MTFAIFDENFYLSNNPDVRAAVNAKIFSSGLQHFQLSGLTEGRVQVSPYYNEQLYLRKYPDVAARIATGAFKSGLQHYIQNGESEGRSPGTFDEQGYLVRYPDIKAAVNAGAFSSGLQHYIQKGQYETNRVGFFSGSSGVDIITGFGANTDITGIDIGGYTQGVDGAFSYTSTRFGAGEIDTLIGGPGRDTFTLGARSVTNRYNPIEFYNGNKNADYARIQNFQPGIDLIRLGGYSKTSSKLELVGGNLNISTLSGDLLAVVEGVTSLAEISDGSTRDGTYLLG